MYDTFISFKEPLLVKRIVYRQFHETIRTRKPDVLDVLYLNRSGGRRGLTNNRELMECMRSRSDVRVIVQENVPMTFEEQVRSVLKRDVYISIHGAAMTHILFMEPLSAVIEFNPPKFKEPFYKNMAHKSSLLYFGIYKTFTSDMQASMALRVTDKILNQWFTVPLPLFNETYALAIGNVWSMKYRMVNV